MIKNMLALVAVATLVLGGCRNGQTQTSKTSLTATEFAEKIKQQPDAPILDVRTPDEFSEGHVKDAKNYDWNGNYFQEQIFLLDKSKPVFVYCLSGGRSGAAAEKMRAEGFKEVYEMQGGLLKWRAAGLPETGAAPAPSGMSRATFDSLLVTDKMVLIDYYATWCAPCQKMKPYLEEIASTMADKVVVIRIDIEDNRNLCKELGIEALPVLQLYKNKVMTWNHTGFIGKEEVLKQLE